VKSAPAFRNDLRTFTPELLRICQQASGYHALVIEAVEDEPHLGIRQKYTGLEMSLTAVQAKGEKALAFIRSFRDGVEAMEKMVAELEREVARVDALSPSEYAAEVAEQP
jgi:hypothetical protein